MVREMHEILGIEDRCQLPHKPRCVLSADTKHGQRPDIPEYGIGECGRHLVEVLVAEGQ